MDKTVFEIQQMDCAAEEQLVRMQLEPLSEIEQLQFDLNQRQLTVYHEGGGEQIQAGIERLIGTIVFVIVLRGALRILQLAK